MCLIWWIYNLQLKADLFNADKLNIICKTKKILKIKREQLLILTILVHVKTGAILVTCN